MRIMRTIYFSFQVAFVLTVFFLVYKDFGPSRGGVIITTNVDEGTGLNHGQKSIDITLPVSFQSFGGCHPHWQQWVGGGAVSYRSLTCDVEKFDPTTGRYEPAPYAGNAWVKTIP